MSTGGVRAKRLVLGLLGILATTGLIWLLGLMEERWVQVAWVALVPWLLVLERLESRREAVLAGAVLGMTFMASVFGWIAEGIQGFSGVSPVACWLGLLVLSPFMQLQFITFALARYELRRTPQEGAWNFWRLTLTGALVYVGTEWFCPKLLADTLGQGFYPSELLRQGADIAGAHGLTLVLVLANECVLAAGKALVSQGPRVGLRRALVPLTGLAVLVLGGFGYGQLRYQQVAEHSTGQPELVVGIVQANITKYEKRAAETDIQSTAREVLLTHSLLSDDLLSERKLDLLVWPETVYPTTFGNPKSEAGAELDAELTNFVDPRGVPLVFGTYDLEQGREYNAAMLLTPTGEGAVKRTAYRKTMLFPLTEWVPESIDSPWLRERMPWTGYWKRGPGPQTLTARLRDGRQLVLAPLICYEAIFPGYVLDEARQGAELLLMLSNDSWFSGTSGPKQHLIQAAFRSIETRLPQVRVTNSGISAIIRPTGEVLSAIPDGQRASIAATVPANPRLPTLMMAWGDWLRPTALVLSGVLLLVPSLLARRRARPVPLSPPTV
jgi:apolipoprotein N-acyltransferase